jgi:hypothetical protein
MKFLLAEMYQRDEKSVVTLEGEVATYLIDFFIGALRLRAYHQYVYVAVPFGLSPGYGAVEHNGVHLLPRAEATLWANSTAAFLDRSLSF